MKLFRTGIATAAVASLMLLPISFANAATNPTVTVSPDNLNGWVVGPDSDSPTPPYAFVPGEHTRGVGSLQFGPISDTAASKMIVEHKQAIATDMFGGVSVDYFIPADSGNQSPGQFYVNVYAKVAGSGTTFYDCGFNYAATAGGVGWHTLDFTGTTPAVEVRARGNGSPATCGTTPAGLAGGSVLSVRLNAGDSSATDVGLKGGFDNVVITSGGNATPYDFDPGRATPCSALPGAGKGTAGNDVLRGTAAADKFDLLGGNDIVDALGGNDCVLGGAGADRLQAGDGNDEVSGGAGQDVIAAGAGNDLVQVADGERDLVDCGAGTDEITVDGRDIVSNCELVTRV